MKSHRRLEAAILIPMAVSPMLDDDPRKAELNRRINALDELVMAETL